MVESSQSVTRPELNPLVSKIAYQQFLWWDGNKNEMKLHRGRWRLVDPATVTVAPECLTPGFRKVVPLDAQML
jgi:hypothetical protein